MKSVPLPRIGMRVVKTAVAVMLVLYHFRALRPHL